MRVNWPVLYGKRVWPAAEMRGKAEGGEEGREEAERGTGRPRESYQIGQVAEESEVGGGRSIIINDARRLRTVPLLVRGREARLVAQLGRRAIGGFET